MRTNAAWLLVGLPLWGYAQVGDTSVTRMGEVEVRAKAPDAVVQA
ncbi:MAG: hypothetical protein RIR07_80, partial [Bacteroidota bacterium]